MPAAARYTRRQDRMRHPALTLRHAFWIACACVLLLPQFAAAEPSPVIDFDGDGRRDQFTLERGEPSVIRVWLSKSDTTQMIRTSVRLLRVAATDLDGDHRPELIALDRQSQIHAWTHEHKAFHPYRPRDVVPRARDQRNRRSVEDKDRGPSGAIASTQLAPYALTLCASQRRPGLEASRPCAPRTGRAGRSSTAVDPFAARPPPAHVPL
jgi:hypothetical protein